MGRKRPSYSKGRPGNRTLVLDLDETLVHTKFNKQTGAVCEILLRPGLEEFLSTCSTHFDEVVAFTAGIKSYGEQVLATIDPDNTFFSRAYFRPSCKILTSGEGHAVHAKDLRSINPADVSNTVIVDNIADNFMLNAGHGIAIRDFLGDTRDTALRDLLPVLIGLATAAQDKGVGTKDYLRKNLLKEAPISALDAVHYRYELNRLRQQQREDKRQWEKEVALEQRSTSWNLGQWAGSLSSSASSSSSSNSSQNSVVSGDE
jgi:Dullard-like phosphatase family protein